MVKGVVHEQVHVLVGVYPSGTGRYVPTLVDRLVSYSSKIRANRLCLPPASPVVNEHGDCFLHEGSCRLSL